MTRFQKRERMNYEEMKDMIKRKSLIDEISQFDIQVKNFVFGLNDHYETLKEVNK